MKLGIGILSWRGEQSLKASLETYKNNNLFILFDEKVIFLPEQRLQETKIAQEFGLSIFGSQKNLGILGGLKALAESMTSEYILLLENDCPIIENFEEAKRQIHLGMDLLCSNKAHIIRLRHREKAGQDWSVPRKYYQMYPPSKADISRKLWLFTKRLMRPQKARRFKAWSIYTQESKNCSLYPEIVSYNVAHDYYLTDSAYLPWTNKSILINRDFFLKVIIAYAEIANTKRRINGFRNLEIEMNSDFWRFGQFKIAIPRGLFTHQRLDERGYEIAS